MRKKDDKLMQRIVECFDALYKKEGRKPSTRKIGEKLGILKFSRDKNAVHPTQKPVALLEYLIRTYTKENEVVMDNCMGSGSSGVACRNTGRQFIGIEADDYYFQSAKERIEKGYGG